MKKKPKGKGQAKKTVKAGALAYDPSKDVLVAEVGQRRLDVLALLGGVLEARVFCGELIQDRKSVV